MAVTYLTWASLCYNTYNKNLQWKNAFDFIARNELFSNDESF